MYTIGDDKMPTTPEQIYYYNIFEKYFPRCHDVLPHYWMPKFVKAID